MWGTLLGVIAYAFYGNVALGGMRAITFVQAFQYWLKLTALAVPVMAANHEIIGAVSVSAASARVRSADLRRRFVPVLRSFATLLAEVFQNVD